MFRLLQKLILAISVCTIIATPAQAIFIQPDWFDPSDPRVGTNRYAYSFNDPINNSDPGGNCPSCAGGIIGGIIGGLAQLGIDAYRGELSSARSYGAAIAGGAVAGATFGLGSSATLGGLAARGALSGATGTTTSSVVGQGQLPSPTELAIGTGIGAVTGPLGGTRTQVAPTSTTRSFDFATEAQALVDDIVAANATTGGGGQVLNGTVESVIQSASYYDTPALQAAGIFRGIIGNHTFVDGNKRTAVQAYRSYAERVGLTVNKTDDEIMDVAGRVANGELDNVDDIAGALQ